MPFNMNFTIDIDPKRRLVVEKIYGIWKQDTALNYRDEFAETAAPLTKGNWAKLINLCNWKSSYPEILEIVGEHLKWCRENGMVWSVNIIDDPTTIKQLKKMFVIGGTEEISRIFKTQEEGEKFLKSQGF